jgi:hypothetical protein
VLSETQSLHPKEKRLTIARQMPSDDVQLLGKPKGTFQKSKFDQNVERIKELLSYGLSVRKIAKVLGYTSHIALNTYINKRGLHQPVRA